MLVCTLGVLHPGVPVMWYTHIRDLSPTAKAERGGGRGAYAQSSGLPWLTNRKSGNRMFSYGYALVSVSDGLVVEGWLGRVSTILHLHTPYTHLKTPELFLSLPPWRCSWRDALCNQVSCRGHGWQAIPPRCPGCPL